MAPSPPPTPVAVGNGQHTTKGKSHLRIDRTLHIPIRRLQKLRSRTLIRLRDLRELRDCALLRAVEGAWHFRMKVLDRVP